MTTDVHSVDLKGRRTWVATFRHRVTAERFADHERGVYRGHLTFEVTTNGAAS